MRNQLSLPKTKKCAFQLLLVTLISLVGLNSTPTFAQDNSYSFDSICETEQGNYEFGVYVRIYGSSIQNSQDIIIDNTEDILTADRLSDEAVSTLSSYVSLKGAIGAEGATELLSNAYPIVNDGLDQVGVNPYGPVTQHVIEYIVGAGSAITTEGIPGGLSFVAEESIATVRDAFFLVPLWSKNKDLRTLNAAQAIAFPYFKSCRDYSYVASQFGYSDDYPRSEAEFFEWMLERIEEVQGSIDEDAATDLLLLLSDGVQQSATSLRNDLGLQVPFGNETQTRNTLNSSTQGDPVITGVTPTVLTGSTNEQTITVRGVNFSSSASLRFNDGTTTYDRDPEFVNASTLRYEINVGTEASDWTVQVRDGALSSNVEAFEVKAATFEDETAPEAPQDLTISEQDWTSQNGFDVFWTNPPDPSGIAKVWYKIGDAPTYSEDGTSLDVQRHNPFSITLENRGETSVHVWLEDNSGNKSHYNRATIVIQRDDADPSITIQEPLDDPSNEDVYETTDGTLTLRGTMSDSQSEIVSVFWINEDVATGFGTFNGSSWTMKDIPLEDGANAIGALVLDGAGNVGFDIIGVQYNAPEENYTLNVSHPNGEVEVDPDRRSFTPGDEVTLTADADAGYEFDEWEGDASGDDNPLTLTMDSDKSITASFTSDDDGGGGDDGPDLVIEDFDVDPSEVETGEEIELEYTVVNDGDAGVNDYTDAEDGFWEVAHYLSEDETLDEGDERLGEARFSAPGGSLLPPRREPGWEEDVEEEENVPDDVSAGDYFVLIVADDNDEVDESGEENNIEEVELTVTEGGGGGDGPDLVIEDESVSPSEAAAGDEVIVSYTVANRGNEKVFGHVEGSFWQVRYYLSTDRNLSDEDEQFGVESYSSLLRGEPGWEDDIEDNTDIPDVSAGDYHVLIVADDDDEVDESSEGNNVETIAFTITDNDSDPPAEIPYNVTRNFGSGSETSDYRLVALPGADEVPLPDALGGAAEADWQAFRQNESGDGLTAYRDAPDGFRFGPGRGFWVIATSDLARKATAETVDLDEDGTYALDLHAGWNIISNPFEKDLAWSAVQEASGASQAIHAFAGGSYEQPGTFASAAGGESYYFYNQEGLDRLLLPYASGGDSAPAQLASAGGKTQRVATLTAPEDAAWTLALTAERRVASSKQDAEQRVHATVRAGAAQGAKAGFDARDQFAPPGRFEAVSLGLRPRADSSLAGAELAAEYRPPAGEDGGHRFPLVLRSAPGEEVTLHAEGIDQLAAGQQALLIRKATGEHFRLSGEAVRFTPEAAEEPLALVVGSAAFTEAAAQEAAPPEPALIGAFPNPFQAQATVAYAVSEPSRVRLTVYDVLGRKVRTLVDERQSPGRKKATLRARSLSSGVYVFRLRIGDYVETGRLVLVR